jgi:hypothetical protein
VKPPLVAAPAVGTYPLPSSNRLMPAARPNPHPTPVAHGEGQRRRRRLRPRHALQSRTRRARHRNRRGELLPRAAVHREQPRVRARAVGHGLGSAGHWPKPRSQGGRGHRATRGPCQAQTETRTPGSWWKSEGCDPGSTPVSALAKWVADSCPLPLPPRPLTSLPAGTGPFTATSTGERRRLARVPRRACGPGPCLHTCSSGSRTYPKHAQTLRWPPCPPPPPPAGILRPAWALSSASSFEGAGGSMDTHPYWDLELPHGAGPSAGVRPRAKGPGAMGSRRLPPEAAGGYAHLPPADGVNPRLALSSASLVGRALK